MTPEQVIHVKNSWNKILPIADKAGQMLYNKILELDPPLQPLFKGDMKEQGQILMGMIDTVVNSLDRTAATIPAMNELGDQHAMYGVKDTDYDTLGAALLWTLQTCLGDKFFPEIKEAWTITYNELARAMKSSPVMAA